MFVSASANDFAARVWRHCPIEAQLPLHNKGWQNSFSSCQPITSGVRTGCNAQAVCTGGGDVLNVGFGLGLVDSAIQSNKPRSHTIIEAHPDVLRKVVQHDQ